MLSTRDQVVSPWTADRHVPVSSWMIDTWLRTGPHLGKVSPGTDSARTGRVRVLLVSPSGPESVGTVNTKYSAG